jgi:ABC-type transport system involved in multi-copper enzyme maturation permease subunit
MFWYKSWLDTRWRFLIGFGILALSACAVVLGYPRAVRLLALVPDVDLGGEIGRRIKESAELMRTYRGYVYAQWFGQNLIQTWTIFAVLLGSGGLVSAGSEDAALFTLSLPISRSAIVAARAATGLAELFILALVPSLLIPLLSPGVGQSYSLVDVLVHTACVFIAGAVFFHVALLLSTVFLDVWRPLLLTLAVALVASLADQVVRGASFGIYRVMSADSYFRGTGVPWVGLVLSAAASGALFYGATQSLSRRDF